MLKNLRFASLVFLCMFFSYGPASADYVCKATCLIFVSDRCGSLGIHRVKGYSSLEEKSIHSKQDAFDKMKKICKEKTPDLFRYSLEHELVTGVNKCGMRTVRRESIPALVGNSCWIE